MSHSIVRRAISVAHRSVIIALFGAFLLAVAGMIERSIFENWSQQIDAPGRLEIEITEGALAANFISVRKPLSELRKLGVSIALDDFGTGYSSMQHLSELLINKIKIDKSFVRSSADPKHNAKIVRSMLGLANSLSMKTTAEGIEQESQALELLRLGCTYGQGYLYSKPISRLACLALIEKWNPTTARATPHIREVI